MSLPDFKILHRNCSCVNDGYASDAMHVDDPCRACDDPFGFNVPIVIDEGRLTKHLSCALALEAA